MIRTGAVLLSLLLPAAVAAHEGDTAGSGGYVGAALGVAQVEDLDRDSVRYDLLVGWRPWRYLAVEGSYVNLGRHNGPTAPDPVLRIDGFGGALLGLLPLDDHNLLLARLGLHKLDIEEGFEPYEVKLARILGVGAEHALSGHVALRAELQAIYGITDRHAAGKYQATSLTVGALYRF